MNTQYCELQDLADYCNHKNGPLTDDEIKGAIFNLCEHLKRTERTAYRAGNEASCLANGIQPD